MILSASAATLVACGLPAAVGATTSSAPPGRALDPPRHATQTARGHGTLPYTCAGTMAASDMCGASFLRVGVGAWCWFAAPQAEFVASRGTRADTIITGFVSNTGGVMVAAINRATGTATVTRVAEIYEDDHAAPSLQLQLDGRITVYYSGHNGARLYYRTTLRPSDVSASDWGPPNEVDTNTIGMYGYTYPNPVAIPSSGDPERTIVFWRGGNWEPAYAIGDPLTNQWSKAHQLLDSPGERPYVKVAAAGRVIGIAYTTGHPRNVPRNAIYYALMDVQTGDIHTAGGRHLGHIGGTPLGLSGANIVYDPGKHGGAPGWVLDDGFANGAPVVLYETIPSVDHHLYWYARWGGRAWANHLVTDAGPTIDPVEPGYPGGGSIDPADGNMVVLSSDVGGVWQITEAATADRGQTWHSYQLTHGSVNNVRPIFVHDMPGAAVAMLWLRGNYDSYGSFHTTVVYDFAGARLNGATTP